MSLFRRFWRWLKEPPKPHIPRELCEHARAVCGDHAASYPYLPLGEIWCAACGTWFETADEWRAARKRKLSK